MPDTIRILKTIRSVVVDCDPKEFDVNIWWSYDRQCGCLIGLSIMRQPKLAAELEIMLVKPYAIRESHEAVLTSTFSHVSIYFDVLAERIGLSLAEASYLFNSQEYPLRSRRGQSGRREALKRLDIIIFRYDHGLKVVRNEGAIVAVTD